MGDLGESLSFIEDSLRVGVVEYKSILGGRGRKAEEQTVQDLRIVELLADILGGEEDEFLKSLYLEQLDSEEVAVFRLSVFQDLLRDEVYGAVKDFVSKIRRCMKLIDLEKDVYEQHKIGFHLDAALIYVEALESFYNSLKALKIRSEGFTQLLNYLQDIVEGAYFRSMKERAYEARKARGRIKVRVRIAGDEIRVWKYDGGENLSALIEEIFSIFKEGEEEEVRYIKTVEETSHVHAAILEGAFHVYRREYEILKKFMEDFPVIVDEGVASFVKEVGFYLTYIEYMRRIGKRGYPFSIPSFTKDGSMHVRGFYNLLLAKSGTVVPNDIDTDGVKRIFVITGMNGGGKTTFAVSLGQLVYLSKLGLPVPATEAKIPFFNSIMTLFPVGEDVGESMSRLEQDVVRALNILKQANSSSLVVANEPFSTTTSDEGFHLAKLFLEELHRKGSFCLLVTFIPRVASLDFVISLVAMPSLEDPGKPSYKILPGSPPSEYTAIRIAARYKLLYNDLMGVLG
jgi:DNA mismatch repair protein MutS